MTGRWSRSSRVDPRSRGGAPDQVSAQDRRRGRSPLTRGSRHLRAAPVGGRGSIPAHAGEPGGAVAPMPTTRVDPRSRGGAGFIAFGGRSSLGRSPLTRGIRRDVDHLVEAEGSIPAHAGEPTIGMYTPRVARVDPRSRGGAFGSRSSNTAPGGRSPLTRGSRRHD